MGNPKDDRTGRNEEDDRSLTEETTSTTRPKAESQNEPEQYANDTHSGSLNDKKASDGNQSESQVHDRDWHDDKRNCDNKERELKPERAELSSSSSWESVPVSLNTDLSQEDDEKYAASPRTTVTSEHDDKDQKTPCNDVTTEKTAEHTGKELVREMAKAMAEEMMREMMNTIVTETVKETVKAMAKGTVEETASKETEEPVSFESNADKSNDSIGDSLPPNEIGNDDINSVSHSVDEYKDSPATLLLREMDDDSPSRKQWLLRKERDRQDIEPLDQLMLKYGLESVKAHFVWVYDEVTSARQRGEDPLKVVVLDTCFVGGSKTGKSTVAGLYGKFLQSLMVIPENKYFRTSDWYSYSVLWSTVMEGEEGRGILHIDNVYKFDDLPSQIARQVEDSEDPVPVFIIEVEGQAQDAMKFIPAPSAKVPTLHVITLPDYTEEELVKILTDAVKKECGQKNIEGGWEGPLMRTFVSRAVKKAGSKSLHSILESVETLTARRSQRVEREEQVKLQKIPEEIFFTKSDMLGLSATEIGDRSEAWKELQKMIGMKKVKYTVKQLLARLALNDRLKLEGMPLVETSSNRQCFIGPPGTGKTTAARLYGQILVDLELVERNKIVTKGASELIGMYVGHSEEATRDALKEAQGGVLIIDDFHLLLPYTMYNTGETDVFRAAVIDTLIENIDPNSQRKEAIILIGYPESMDEAFEKANPGLARRFPLEQAFRFEPYDDEQLAQILELKLDKLSLSASAEGIGVAKGILSIARHRPNFGNGGDVENLLQSAMARRNDRCAAVDAYEDIDLELLPQDFDPDFDRGLHASERSVRLFKELVGMADIMSQFQQYQVMAARLRSRGHDPRRYVPWALVFRGPPGTGKTTVARKIGEIYYDMGFISAAEVIECSVADLISSYVGGSGKKVIRMFERALGKVLFIDEAYRLGEVNADDAIGEMVDCMTKERFFGNLVVVLAGYKEDIEKLMLRNRGLRSRFATHIDFSPLTAQDMLALLRKHLADVDIQLGEIDPDAGSWQQDEVLHLLAQLSQMQSWANGRDVVAFARIVIEHVYTRGEGQVGLEPDKDLVVHANDLIPLLKKRLSGARKDEREMGVSHEVKMNDDAEDRDLWDGDVNGVSAMNSKATMEPSTKMMPWMPQRTHTARYGEGSHVEDLEQDDKAAITGSSDLIQYPQPLDLMHEDIEYPYSRNSNDIAEARSNVVEVLSGLQSPDDALSTLGEDGINTNFLTDGIGAQAMMLSERGLDRRREFDRTGNSAFLDDAIKMGSEAVSAVPIGHHDRAALLINLETSILRKFEHTGQLDVLKEALSSAREAVNAAPPSHPDRASALGNLGLCLRFRFEQLGYIKDIHEAVRVGNESVNINVDDDSGRAVMLANLSVTLWRRFERLGKQMDLEEAINRGEEAIALMPPAYLYRSSALLNLSTSLMRKFERTGNMDALRSAISRAEEAASTMTDGHTDKGSALDNLGNCLRFRFDRTGDLNDLNRAIQKGESAVALTRENHIEMATRLSNLGGSYFRRFERTSSLSDLNQAIDKGRRAMDAANRVAHHQVRDAWQMFNNLGMYLKCRFERTHNPEDLRLAIEMEKEAVKIIDDDNPYKVTGLINLANSLYLEYERSERLNVLNEAIDRVESAVRATPRDHPSRTASLNSAAIVRWARYRKKRNQYDRDQAIHAVEEALDVVSAPPRNRIIAAVFAIMMLAPEKDWKRLGNITAKAVELLPKLSPRALAQHDQQHMLGEFSGLACLAASLSLESESNSDRPVGYQSGKAVSRALHLLELGRGIIMGLQFGTRTDLTDLRDKYPDMAERFERLRDELDSEESRLNSGPNFIPSAHKRSRHDVASDLDNLVQEIQDRLPGFSNFQKPLPESELVEAASAGPIVIVNVSPFRSHALLISRDLPERIRAVPLTNLHFSEIQNRLNKPVSPEMLEWLWTTTACPILNELGFRETPAGDWPRVWWIPTGLMSRLPLHAAGLHYTMRGETVLDRVVSSYISSIKALVYARQIAQQKLLANISHRALLVSMRKTAEASDLLFAEHEVAAVDWILPLTIPREKLTQPCKKDVIASLNNCTMFHFAGHSSPHPDDPSKSCLFLEDWTDDPLTVGDLASLKLYKKSSWLAYLSACSTGESKSERLQDETIHLVSACQLAGFPHVVGSLWAVDDEYSMRMSRQVYKTVANMGWDNKMVALAVHKAARLIQQETRGAFWGPGYAMRDEGRPSIWAAYIHVGP